MASLFNHEIDRLWVLAWRPYQPRYRVPKPPVYARITLRCHVGKCPHAGIHLVRHPVVPHHLRAVVETAGLALHDEEPERISRLFDKLSRIFRSEVSVRGHAASAASAASSRRPSRPSADAFSWAISYSRVAYPERSKFNAIGARSETWPADYLLSIGRQGVFKTKRRGARSYAKWELCWRSRSRISVIEAAADIYSLRIFSQFGTPPSPSSPS
jgi:hypothetical protein